MPVSEKEIVSYTVRNAITNAKVRGPEPTSFPRFDAYGRREGGD